MVEQGEPHAAFRVKQAANFPSLLLPSCFAAVPLSSLSVLAHAFFPLPRVAVSMGFAVSYNNNRFLRLGEAAFPTYGWQLGCMQVASWLHTGGMWVACGWHVGGMWVAGWGLITGSRQGV